MQSTKQTKQIKAKVLIDYMRVRLSGFVLWGLFSGSILQQLRVNFIRWQLNVTNHWATNEAILHGKLLKWKNWSIIQYNCFILKNIRGSVYCILSNKVRFIHILYFCNIISENWKVYERFSLYENDVYIQLFIQKIPWEYVNWFVSSNAVPFLQSFK